MKPTRSKRLELHQLNLAEASGAADALSDPLCPAPNARAQEMLIDQRIAINHDEAVHFLDALARVDQDTVERLRELRNST